MASELEQVLLERWQIAPAALLGQGGESKVYGLELDRVLGLYNPGMLFPYAERRQAFYARLRDQHPPFEVLYILSVGVIEDQCYTIEQRMQGQDFGKVLPMLSGVDRMTALISYLRVVEQIGKDVIQFYRLYYSLYFSGCKMSDPPTYWWCVENMCAYLSGS